MMSFTYVNEAQIDLELICNICRDPLQTPVNCVHCGHTVCDVCITIWHRQHTSCPNCRRSYAKFIPVISRIVHNQLNRLLVDCNLCNETNIQRGNYDDHFFQACPKRTVDCSDQCGWKGYRENLEQHLVQCRRNRQVVTCRILWAVGWAAFALFMYSYVILDFRA